MNLREVIKARRKVLGISQQDLAEMSGISLPTVKDIARACKPVIVNHLKVA